MVAVTLISAAGLVAASAAACLVAAARYRTSALEVAAAVARHGALTAVRVATAIHDPTTRRVARLGPVVDGREPSYEGYERIEGWLGSRGGRLRLVESTSPRIVRSRFSFAYQPEGEPRLGELRRRYRLDEVVAPASNDFEALLRLRDWSRGRFRRADYQPIMEDFDALAVLDRDLRNERGAPFDPRVHIDPCHFFPMLFAEVALAMGYQARLVQISHEGRAWHGMVEVWTNHFRKWVALDAELCLHYERDGVPLSLLEVHEERYAPDGPRLRIVRGRPEGSDPSPTLASPLGVDEPDPAFMVDYFGYFRIVDMRNDWMTNHYFRGHPARSDGASLTFVDPRMPRVLDFRPSTSDPDDFYWTLNETEVLVRPPAEGRTLPLAFRTVTPGFDRFEVRLDGGAPRTTRGPSFDWPLHPGRNVLEVRSVNALAVEGIPSRVVVEAPLDSSDRPW